MADNVFEVVTLSLEDIGGIVLGFPAGAATGSEVGNGKSRQPVILQIDGIGSGLHHHSGRALTRFLSGCILMRSK